MVQKFLEYLIQFPIKSSKYFNNAACNAKSPKNIFSEVCHLDIENRGIRLVFEKKKNVVFIIFNSLKDGYCLNNELFKNMNEKMSCIIILEQGTESSSKHDGVEWPLGVFIIFYFKY